MKDLEGREYFTLESGTYVLLSPAKVQGFQVQVWIGREHGRQPQTAPRSLMKLVESDERDKGDEADKKYSPGTLDMRSIRTW